MRQGEVKGADKRRSSDKPQLHVPLNKGIMAAVAGIFFKLVHADAEKRGFFPGRKALTPELNS